MRHFQSRPEMNQSRLSELQYQLDRQALQDAITVLKSLKSQSWVLLVDIMRAELMLQIMDTRMMIQRVQDRLVLVHTYRITLRRSVVQSGCRGRFDSFSS